MTPDEKALTPRLTINWGARAPILALVAGSLAVGFLLTPHYGQSTDEAPNLNFARETLNSYQHPDRPYDDITREDKGPFYLMVWLKVGEFLGSSVPGWLFVDGRHFVNFITFQLAVLSTYSLALRFVRPAAALAGVLLFETQPLFFGHAFINQKDTPFMAFFALTLVFGLGMVDRFLRTGPNRPRSAFGAAVGAAGGHEPRRARRAAIVVVLLATSVPILSLVLQLPLRAAVEGVVTSAYRGEAWAPINQLFVRLAEHAAQVPVEDYVHRANRVTTGAILLASVGMIGAATAVAAKLWPNGARAGALGLVADVRQSLDSPLPLICLPAAIVFGMSIAIRSMALFAGLLVVGYALIRAGPRIAILLMAYFAVAAVVAYALWPQLWGSPLGAVLDSLDRTLQYPQEHSTLLDGTVYSSNNLPFWYLPHVMAIQLTLPAIVFVIGGLFLGVRSGLGREFPGATAWVLLLWFLAPFVAVVGFRTPIYNYFRHVLFMMPPLFVFAAIAIERLLRLARAPLVGTLLVVAILLPGVWATIKLHPYEYGYFNELVGGVRGAKGRYIPDYWCTSFRETMHFLNDYAPSSAEIFVTGPEDNAIPFAREDLFLRDDSELATNNRRGPVLILGCSWATVNQDYYPDAHLLWSVEREGVPLAIVKSLATPESAVP
jgi:hypothetical protein